MWYRKNLIRLNLKFFNFDCTKKQSRFQVTIINLSIFLPYTTRNIPLFCHPFDEIVLHQHVVFRISLSFYLECHISFLKWIKNIFVSRIKYSFPCIKMTVIWSWINIISLIMMKINDGVTWYWWYGGGGTIHSIMHNHGSIWEAKNM